VPVADLLVTPPTCEPWASHYQIQSAMRLSFSFRLPRDRE
jgi:hypothetical protein